MSSEIQSLATNIQHQEPSVYYCYKFWLSTGEVREGCTDVMSTGKLWGLDLNEHGWVYMTVPIVGLFALIVVFMNLCGTKDSKSVPTQPPPSNPKILSQSSSRNPLYSVVPVNSISQKKRIYPLLNRKASVKKPLPFKSTAHVEKEIEAEGLLKEEDPPLTSKESVSSSVHSVISSAGTSKSSAVVAKVVAEVVEEAAK